jgi:hypothetical protein
MYTPNKDWRALVQKKAIELAEPGAPEEEHFNTAMILLHDQVPEQEMAELQRDLRSVETNTPVQYAYEEDDDWDDYDDPAWCYDCNHDIAFCECQPLSGGCPDCGYKVESCRC